MRLAYVINSLEAGGAQYPIPRIVAGLRAHGIATTVYALSRRDDLAVPALEAAGVPMIRAPFAKAQHLAGYRWLAAELARQQPDAIWTSLTQATLLGQRVGKRHRIPVISWQHNAFLKPANRRLLRLQRRISQFWVADSESVAAFTQNELGVAESEIEILPLYVARSDAPQATPYVSGPFEWLSVGRLHPNKNYAALIEVFASIAKRDDVRLRIAGQGSEHERLDALIAQLDLSDCVQLLGHVGDIPALLATAHGYIQPSHNEGLCIAAHEAMAASLPCLVSKTGQMALTVTPGHAFSAQDPSCMRRVLHHVMSDVPKFSATGATNRARVLERFSQARFDAAIAAIAARLRDVTQSA